MNSFGTFGFDKTQYVLRNFNNILHNKCREVSIDKILKKICVTPPYFIFDKIFEFEDILIAPIQPEQTIEFEATPISSAEAARHLAILGSCCFVNEDNEEKYYLTNKALKRSNKNIDVLLNQSKKLYVIAISKFSGKMECLSYSALINEDGEIIFEADICFQKLSKKLFSRVFKKHLKPTNKVNTSPYKNSYKHLQNVIQEGSIIKAELPEIDDEECAGHFDGAPMLPIGIMSYIITSQIGEILKKIDNNQESKFYILEADLRVFEPTDLKNKEFVEIRYLVESQNIYKFSWEVRGLSGTLRNTAELIFSKKL